MESTIKNRHVKHSKSTVHISIMFVKRIFLTILLATLISPPDCLLVPNIDATIRHILNTITNSQEQTDVQFKEFPWTWEKLKGMYPNEVRLNFHGDLEQSLIREAFKVPDNNMFTPAWVTMCLIEAFAYGQAPKPGDTQVDLALNVIDRFRNKNVGYNNSEMSFWMQEYNNTAEFYQSSPRNLFGVLDVPSHLPIKVVEEILNLVGLKGLEKIVDKLLHDRNMFFASFHIPPDFDDTFVNLGLGGMLSFLRQDFPRQHDSWTRQNNNLSSIFNSVKKYAYRPFSTDQRRNTIDSRTYFYMRQFLDESAAEGESLSLVPTWMQDTDEVRRMFDKGVAMPFNVNNVDVTVSANFLYGVVSCAGTGVCSNPEAIIDETIQQLFENTTSLIAHEIRSNLSSRPDLALTYYPSKFEFYWFVSRSYAWLHRHLDGVLPRLLPRLQKMLTTAVDILGPVLKNDMTVDILNCSSSDSNEYAFVDNFLGDGDIDAENRTTPKWEDRVFSTSVSMNALINTWTTFDNGKLLWTPDTPPSVKTFTEKAARWLTDNVENKRFKLWNTFFSGSGKSFQSLPFSFPANRHEYFNGTTFSDDKFPTTYKNILAMQGYVTPDNYDVMLQQPHFGLKTPLTFEGYNSEAGGFFPFWSSDPYTLATSLVALSHYRNIKEIK